MSNIILQGVDCWIEAKNIINARTGAPLNVTGFTVRAVARALYERTVLGRRRYYTHRLPRFSPVVAEWHTSPTGTQGTAIAGGVADPYRVQLHVTPSQSSNWLCPLVSIQAEMTDPVTGYVDRIISEVYEVDFEAVR
ncbi:MAG: hypothetical protein ACRDTZ_10975 [Pseudonocardiaceae bacterium]